MIPKQIKQELCSKANSLDACSEELQALRAAKTMDELFALYWSNIHFCIRRDFPTARFFRRTMRAEARKRHIYVDESNTLNAADGYKAIFLGDCRSVVNTGDNHFARLYVKHTSEVIVHVSPGSVVVIDLFDSAKVVIIGAEMAKVSAFKMGGGHVEGEGVRVFEKQLNP